MNTAEVVDIELVGRVAEYLATTRGAKARDVADAAGVTYEDLRDLLLELERQGIVFRTGRTRGTRWWLG